MKSGIDILISTIDRFEKHREKNNVFLSNVNYLVIDEADTFLDNSYKDMIDGYVKIIQ